MSNPPVLEGVPAEAVLVGEEVISETAPPLLRTTAIEEANTAVPTVAAARAQQAEHNDITSLLILLATVFLPPLGAYLLKGCRAEVVIAVGLTILGWIPGILYVLWLWLQAGGFQRKDVAERRVALAKAKWQARRAARQAKQQRQAAAAAASTEQPETAPLMVAEQAPSLPVLGSMNTPSRPASAMYAAPDYSKVAAVQAYPLPRSSGSFRQQSAMPGPSSAPPAGFMTAPSTAEPSSTTAETIVATTSSDTANKPATSGGAILVEEGVEKPIQPDVKSLRKGKGKVGDASGKPKSSSVGGLYMGLFSKNKDKAREAKPEPVNVAAEDAEGANASTTVGTENQPDIVAPTESGK